MISLNCELGFHTNETKIMIVDWAGYMTKNPSKVLFTLVCVCPMLEGTKIESEEAGSSQNLLSESCITFGRTDMYQKDHGSTM